MRRVMLLGAAALVALPDSKAAAEIVATISTSSAAVAAGEPAVVTVQVSSSSAEVVVPRLLRPPSHYLAFEVRDEQGKVLEFVGALVRLRVDPKDVIRLGPASILEARFDLAQLYDLSRPGTYSVTAVYGRPPTSRWRYVDPVRSNAITLRVGPKRCGGK